MFDIPDGGATIRRKLDVLARHCDDVAIQRLVAAAPAVRTLENGRRGS